MAKWRCKVHRRACVERGSRRGHNRQICHIFSHPLAFCCLFCWQITRRLYPPAPVTSRCLPSHYTHQFQNQSATLHFPCHRQHLDTHGRAMLPSTCESRLHSMCMRARACRCRACLLSLPKIAACSAFRLSSATLSALTQTLNGTPKRSHT